MKVILTHCYFINDDDREKLIMKPYPPLGILSIAAYVEEKGLPVTVFDSTFSSFDKQKEHLLKEKPDVIGVYTNLMTRANVIRVCRFIKSTAALKHTRIILGGPEVKHNCDRLLECGADIIVLGEGEETFYELLQTLNSNSNLEDVKSIAFISKGQPLKTAERTFIKNIDTLPSPARHKIDMSLYFNAWRERHGYAMLNVSTMRGCPYTCKWCSRAVYGKSYRRKSPELVLNELSSLVNDFGVKRFWFVDDVFNVSHKWLAAFAEEVEKSGLNFEYECITRADRMSEEVINLLKRSGCVRVWVGAESGSQRIIDAMDRRVEVNQVSDVIRRVSESGMESGTFIMIGYPGEEEKDIFETVKHLKRAAPDHFTITLTYPIKGTELYAELEQDFEEQSDWENSSDRNIRFKRKFSDRYYNFAVRYIHNSVTFSKGLQKRNFSLLPFTAAKIVFARTGMMISKLL